MVFVVWSVGYLCTAQTNFLRVGKLKGRKEREVVVCVGEADREGGEKKQEKPTSPSGKIQDQYKDTEKTRLADVCMVTRLADVCIYMRY